MSDLYQFLNEGTNLDTPGSWYDETTGLPGGPPGSTDVAMITYGQLLTGTLSVDVLLLEQGSAGSTLSLTGTATSVGATTTAVAGTVVLENGATLTIDTLELLGGGTTLALRNGALLNGDSPDDASVTIGTSAAASVLSVSGLTTNFEYSTGGSLFVGDAASSNATISITGGGAMGADVADALIGASDNATATLLVSNPSSVAEISGLVEIGDLGTGVVTVTNGGYASLGEFGNGVFLGVADDTTAPATGKLTVTGANSAISIGSDFYVGVSGFSTGTVTASAGGVLSVAGDTFLSAGTINVTGAGSAFDARTLVMQTAQTPAGLTISTGGTVGIVTLDLNAGKVSLSAGDLGIRRSAYISAGTTITGHGTVTAGAIYNAGLLDASGGTLSFIGPVSEKGLAHIESGATLLFDGTVTNGLAVAFEAATGTLALDNAAGFTGIIGAMGAGSVIDLLGDAATTLTASGAKLIVKNGTSTVATLTFSAAHPATSYKLTSDGHGGSDITYSAANVIPAYLHAIHAI